MNADGLESRTPHLDDERLSALIDGDATAADEQHVRTCAGCGAALAAWRRTVDALDALDALDAVAEPASSAGTDRRHLAVAAALAAAAGTEAAGAPSTATGPVPRAEHAEHRRQRAAFLSPRVAAAAAAVIVVAGLAVGLSAHSGGGTSHPAAASAGSTIPAGAGAAGPSGASPSAAAASGVSGSSSVGPDLGSFQNPAGVVAALRERLNPAAAGGRTPATPGAVAPPAASGAVSACLPQAASYARVPAHSQPVVAAGLTYRGSRAQVYVFEVGRGHTATVVGEPGCGLLTLAAF